MIGRRSSSSQYLTVSATDRVHNLEGNVKMSLHPPAQHSMYERSSSTPELRPTESKLKSIVSQDDNGSSSSGSIKSYKSNETLCFPIFRKNSNGFSHEHITEIYRPRCYTNPQQQQQPTKQHHTRTNLPKVIIEHQPMNRSLSNNEINDDLLSGNRNVRSSALNSLIFGSLQLTGASIGLETENNGLRCLPKSSPDLLSNDERFKLTTSSNSSFNTLNYGVFDTSMAPLPTNADGQSVTNLRISSSDLSPSSGGGPLKRENRLRLSRSVGSTQSDNSLSPITTTAASAAAATTNGDNSNSVVTLRSSKKSFKNLKINSSPGDRLAPATSSNGLDSVSPLRKSPSVHIFKTTARNEQFSTTAASGTSAAVVAQLPPEKEKKRKEVSSSRVKKFHRHFSQVSKDEKLINYFSCALVSDILLQGHLYITDQHFAFYSNVFGYVTKVVIPTASVTKISKEKTAKIIPNAVGVATADERHVFGSFISREAAFRLMCSVCPPMAPTALALGAEMAAAAAAAAAVLPKHPADIEVLEEYSLEDDSSCSISASEGSGSQTLHRRTVGTSSLNSGGKNKSAINNKSQYSDIPSSANAKMLSIPSAHSASSKNLPSSQNSNLCLPSSSLSTTTTTGAAASAASNLTMIIAGNVSSSTSSGGTGCGGSSSSPTPSNSSTPITTVTATSGPVTVKKSFAGRFLNGIKNILPVHLKSPSELHLVCVGVFLAVVLAFFSVFLLYRILNIEAKAANFHSTLDFSWHSSNDEDMFAEALRWQRELQTKSTEEAQSILSKNLEQIAKVRRSLETLSMLIHDRHSELSKGTNAGTDADDSNCN